MRVVLQCTLLAIAILAVNGTPTAHRLPNRIHTSQPQQHPPRTHPSAQPAHPVHSTPQPQPQPKPLGDGNCTSALDVSVSVVSANTFGCLIQAGYQQVSVPITFPNCTIDAGIVNSVKNAFVAGMNGADIVLIPANRSCNLGPQQQVSQALMTFGRAQVQINRLWFDVTTSASPAGWAAKDCPTNRRFLGPAIRHAARHLGPDRVGIRTSQDDWQALVCGDNEYDQFSLWYERHDGQNNMNDWNTSNFGGWRNPLVKQYSAPATVCGVTINSDVRRDNVC